MRIGQGILFVVRTVCLQAWWPSREKWLACLHLVCFQLAFGRGDRRELARADLLHRTCLCLLLCHAQSGSRISKKLNEVQRKAEPCPYPSARGAQEGWEANMGTGSSSCQHLDQGSPPLIGLTCIPSQGSHILVSGPDTRSTQTQHFIAHHWSTNTIQRVL